MKENVTELIRQAQGGVQSAFSALKDIYRPLIDASVYRFTSDSMTDQDKEDIFQEVLVHFCNSVCSYDCDSGGVEFGLYAKICIENGLISYMRLYNRQNRLRPVELEGDGDAALFDTGEVDVLQSIIDHERTALLIRRVNKRLSKLENKIWWLYVSGMNVSAIAKDVGVDNKSVSNAIYRIRKKLKDALKEQI